MDGRNVLVTAGARHLGARIAEVFAAKGADVAVNYRGSRDEAEELAESMKARHGGNHMAVQADVSSRTDVSRMIDDVESRFGGIDVLVNNAGPYSKTPFLELQEDEWDQVVDSNLKASYLCASAVAPGMRSRGWGRIVNISAVSAYVRNRATYGLSKAALHTLTESLAVELGPEITVNAVAPGQIAESLEEMSGIDPGWAEAVAGQTPLGRLVTREEVAEMIVSICGSQFDMVTGHVLPMDGGLRIARF